MWGDINYPVSKRKQINFFSLGAFNLKKKKNEKGRRKQQENVKRLNPSDGQQVARTRLFILEVGLPFLHKCCHAFSAVFGCKRGVEETSFCV